MEQPRSAELSHMGFERITRAFKSFAAAPLLSAFAPVIETRCGNRRVRVDLRDRIIGRSVFIYHAYETELQRLMSHMALAGGVCVDVGANIGLHTIEMSALAGDRGKVFAFEPETHNYELLRYNLEANGCGNVQALNFGVSDGEGVAFMRLSDINFGDHRLATGAEVSPSSPQVKLISLDKALDGVPQGAIRFIKIDVQGHEMQVIRGMERTLARNPDAILMIEVSPDILPKVGSSASELMGFFVNRGYRAWELQDHRVFPAPEPWTYEFIRNGRWADVLFCRNEAWLREVMSNYAGRAVPVPEAVSAAAIA
ncbi:MAG: FkbM family methyltransferase [Bryobacteraceae bacterium]